MKNCRKIHAFLGSQSRENNGWLSLQRRDEKLIILCHSLRGAFVPFEYKQKIKSGSRLLKELLLLAAAWR